MNTTYLFSYGTLRQTEVQRAVFGREVAGYPDALLDHRVGSVRITDAEVIATSGSDIHPILQPARGNQVTGVALKIDTDDLPAADAYEVDDYVRMQVALASGRTAWAYVADGTPKADQQRT